MGEFDDAIKLEKKLKQLASLYVSAQAKQIDALIMGRESVLKFEHAQREAQELFGYPVITSEYMPEGGVVIFERPERKPLHLHIDADRGKYYASTEISMHTGRMMSIGLWQLPLSATEIAAISTTISPFIWSRWRVFVLFALSLIIITLLLAYVY